MTSIVLTEDQLLLAKELDELRHQQAVARKREAVVRALLLDALDAQSADRALTASGLPALSIGEQSRRSVNQRKLEALYPDVFADVVETSLVRTLSISL